ncbi:unnamed protein product, partial [Prorocentrum cordatum]
RYDCAADLCIFDLSQNPDESLGRISETIPTLTTKSYRLWVLRLRRWLLPVELAWARGYPVTPDAIRDARACLARGRRREFLRLHALAIACTWPMSAPWRQSSSLASGAHELHLMCYASQQNRGAELLRRGAPMAARDRLGRAPLHWSCARGDFDIAQALVEAAADPPPLAEAAAHRGGETPLELGALQGHVGAW